MKLTRSAGPIALVLAAIALSSANAKTKAATVPSVIGHYAGSFTPANEAATPPLFLDILTEGTVNRHGIAHISGTFSDWAPGQFRPEKFQGTISPNGAISGHHKGVALRVSFEARLSEDGKTYAGLYTILRPHAFFQQGSFQVTLQPQ